MELRKGRRVVSVRIPAWEMKVPGWAMGLAMVVWMLGFTAGAVLSHSGTMTVRMRDCTVTSLAFASVTSRW